MFDINLIILIVFLFLFAIHAFRYQQFNWLWFGVAIWLVLGLFSSSVLPSVLGITRITNFYLLHGYIFAGSIFFFLNEMEKLPNRMATWHTPRTGNYLSLLASSGLVMHLAFGVMVLLAWFLYPSGQSVMLSARLMTLYVWQPEYWWGMQTLLMLLFAAHRKLVGDEIHVISVPQLQIGVLIALLWQFLHLMNAYLWLPLMIQKWFQAA